MVRKQRTGDNGPNQDKPEGTFRQTMNGRKDNSASWVNKVNRECDVEKETQRHNYEIILMFYVLAYLIIYGYVGMKREINLTG